MGSTEKRKRETTETSDDAKVRSGRRMDE